MLLGLLAVPTLGTMENGLRLAACLLSVPKRSTTEVSGLTLAIDCSRLVFHDLSVGLCFGAATVWDGGRGWWDDERL